MIVIHITSFPLLLSYFLHFSFVDIEIKHKKSWTRTQENQFQSCSHGKIKWQHQEEESTMRQDYGRNPCIGREEPEGCSRANGKFSCRGERDPIATRQEAYFSSPQTHGFGRFHPCWSPLFKAVSARVSLP